MEPKKKGGILKEDKNLTNPPHGNPVKKDITKASSPPDKKWEKAEDDPKKKKEDKDKAVKEPTPEPPPAEVASDNPKGDDDYRKTDQDKDLLM